MTDVRAPVEPPPVRGRRPTVEVAGLLLAVLYFGLLSLGKGFAYMGSPPIFVAELVLVVLCLLVAQPSLVLPSGAAPRVALLFVVSGSLQLVIDVLYSRPSLVEELRGFALVYYALFAVITFGVLAAIEDSSRVMEVVGRIESLWTVATPVVVALTGVLALQLTVGRLPAPTWPGSGISLLVTKSTDISVALAAVLPFVVSRWRRRLPWWRLIGVLWCATALLTAARSRAAVIGISVGLVVTFGLSLRVAIRGVGIAVGVYVLMVLTNFSVRAGGRELSAAGLRSSVVSIVRPDGTSNYAGTTRWRTTWWRSIWSDIEQHGFWLHANGWHDNLARRFSLAGNSRPQEFVALRLPHNTFFSIAGRAGLVAAVLYLAVGVSALVATRSSRLHPSLRHAPLVRSLRAALIAGVGVGLTDVYIESPQGGIVFWCSVGALWWVARSRPQPSTDL